MGRELAGGALNRAAGPNPAENPARLHRAFVAFSGGGAKGLIHIGALKALEERHVEFRGLAGTSAGAIVASLKAAGFRADELVNAGTGETLIDHLQKVDPRIQRATDLFGIGGWYRIVVFRWLMRQHRLMWVVVLIMGWSLPLAVGIRVGIGGSAWFLIAILVLWAFIGLLVCWGGRWILSGLGDASLFRDALAALLQRKMFPDEPGRIVRMKDFGVTRPSLKIVSDNLNRRRLQLFSPERTPEEVTADAVAASIRLPLIFRPWRIDGELHVDGGIVSNLPAWPFDEERELDPEALTITVEAADSTDKAGARAVNWLPAAIRTALFGADELNLRLSGVAERLVLETKLDVLQFDLSLPQVREEVRDAWRAASLRLDTQLFRVPELYRDACRVIQDTTVEVLRGVLNGNPGKVRVAVGVRDQDFHHSVRLRYSVGFENDHDEAILCPVSGSVIGMAWLTGETQFEVAPLPDRFQFPGLSNRLRRVVQIDGDASIPKAGTAIGNAVAAIENAVIRLFQQIRDQLA